MSEERKVLTIPLSQGIMNQFLEYNVTDKKLFGIGIFVDLNAPP